MFLGKLEAARKLTSQAKESEEAWLEQGRKEGLDVDKVVKVLNESQAKLRREHPDRVMPDPAPEAATSTMKST